MDILKVITLNLFCIAFSYGQQISFFTEQLFNEYPKYKVEGFSNKKVEPEFLQKRLGQVLSKAPDFFDTQVLGYSVEGRPIRMVSVGNGKVNILMWSQMHGNESTATRSIVDLLSFFAENKKKKVVNLLWKRYRGKRWFSIRVVA